MIFRDIRAFSLEGPVLLPIYGDTVGHIDDVVPWTLFCAFLPCAYFGRLDVCPFRFQLFDFFNNRRLVLCFSLFLLLVKVIFFEQILELCLT